MDGTLAFQKLRSDALAIFEGPECTQYVLDVIEWHYSSLLAMQQRAAQRLKQVNLVPGKMHCAKCKFVLTRVNLNVTVGTVTAGGSESEPCPNGCGPLWPITWEQEAREAWATCESQMDRALVAENALAELQDRLGPVAVPEIPKGDGDLARPPQIDSSIQGDWHQDESLLYRLDDEFLRTDKIEVMTVDTSSGLGPRMSRATALRQLLEGAYRARAAVRTLERLGYVHTGGVEWRPPRGPGPAWLDSD